MRGPRPLVHRRIETITAVKNVGVGHVAEIPLADSCGVGARAERIQRVSLYDGVRAIRLCRRICELAKHTEVSELTGVRRAVRIRGGPERITERIYRCDCRIGARSAGHRIAVAIGPTVSVTENAVPGA